MPLKKGQDGNKAYTIDTRIQWNEEIPKEHIKNNHFVCTCMNGQHNSFVVLQNLIQAKSKIKP